MKKETRDFFNKYHESNSNNSLIRNRQKNQNSKLVWIIGLIMIIVLAVFGYLWMQSKPILLPTPSNVDTWYRLWDEISKEGTLIASGDIITYTHILETRDHEIFLLKSKTIPLNNYSSHLSGVFQIYGKIEAFQNNLPLVEVSTIWDLLTSETSQKTWENISQEILPGAYVADAGIYFTPAFFDSYTFVWEPGNNKITVKNLENEKQTTIDFFHCTNQGNTDCNQLLKTFESNADQTVISNQGTKFIKLVEVNSRYFQNEDRWGYFINDADAEEIKQIKDLIVLPNKEMIKDIVNQYGTKVCVGTNNGLTTITSHSIRKTSKGISIDLKGEGDNLIDCVVELDLNRPEKLQFIDLKMTALSWSSQIASTWLQQQEKPKEELPKKDPEVKEETPKTSLDSSVTTDTQWNPNVAQFPINKEKALTYSSSRGGYLMSFPSSNIAYASNSADKNFDQVGVQCSIGIHVIKFSEKENLNTDPAVIVYECKSSSPIKVPGEQYLLKTLWEKQFVIHVRNGAWLDFARNITISEIPTP